MQDTTPHSNRSSILSYYRTPRIQSESISFMREIMTERICTNCYTNRYSPDNKKWSQIFKNCESNVVKYHNRKQLKEYFRRWNNILGEKHVLAFVNYANFYNLRKLPNYKDVRNSSAGLEGWTPRTIRSWMVRGWVTTPATIIPPVASVVPTTTGTRFPEIF